MIVSGLHRHLDISLVLAYKGVAGAGRPTPPASAGKLQGTATFPEQRGERLNALRLNVSPGRVEDRSDLATATCILSLFELKMDRDTFNITRAAVESVSRKCAARSEEHTSELQS